MIETKVCSKCKEEKELSEFSNQASGKFGKKAYCKVCDRARNKELYEQNKDERIVQVQLWQQKNVDKYKKYQKDYHAAEKS